MLRTEIRPGLWMLVDDRGMPAYLLRRGNTVVLVDTGSAGNGAALVAARPTHVVLTHWHPDHTGSAAEIRAATGATVLAHRLDAPIVRGDATGAEPVFTPAERDLHARVAAGLPPAPHPAGRGRALIPCTRCRRARRPASLRS